MAGTTLTHYERLGVAPTASVDEIRAAYRNVARRAHPDSAAGGHDGEMAAVNEAWRVLSDPGRRALYDRSLSAAAGSGATAPAPVPDFDPDEYERAMSPAQSASRSGRFPIWPFVLIFVMIAIFIFTAGGLSDDPAPPRPDSLLAPGSCVTVVGNGDVVETACSAPHDGVVVTVVGFDQQCPGGTAVRRDRQGRGWACLVDG